MASNRNRQYGKGENLDRMIKDYKKSLMDISPKSITPPTPTKSNMSSNKWRENISNDNTMTTSLGNPVYDDENALTLGVNGPTLMQDAQTIDKIGHFTRERTPERVVHAKGAGAFGHFKAYGTMKDLTTANFLNDTEKDTPILIRFSTVIGSLGSADTERDPRGFAIKFYTDEGIQDIVGLSLPIFFIRDAIKFPDVIHSLKPAPNTNTRESTRFWDFVSLSPEATHMITWLYSDRGTVKSYRHIEGFGVNTYIFVDPHGTRRLIKFHFKTMQGVQTIDRRESTILAGTDPDVARNDLYNSIKTGEKTQFELCVQVMEMSEVDSLPYDPLDDTKTWDEQRFPLIKAGMLTLDKNPENFFAEIEQAAFCPANIVPGIEISADKMLQTRSFAYADAQRHRIGINYAQLPVNRSKSHVFNNEQDGHMRIYYRSSGTNYSPNSLDGNMPYPSPTKRPDGPFYSGEVMRKAIVKTDDFTQAGERYRKLTTTEREHLCDNVAVELWKAPMDIQNRVLEYFYNADENFANQVIRLMKMYKNK